VAVLVASRLRKEIAGEPLFDSVSFKLERRDRLALSGPNGAGKTTLLRILTGETRLDGGELAFEKGTRVALHDQRPPLERGFTLREYVLSGASELVATEQELARLEGAMADGAHDPATLHAYSRAQARLEHAGGYGWRNHAAAVVRGLGFADADLDRRLSTFSGGELTRASLARALAGDPDLLLLDEPTNHLDVTSIEWLEAELSSLDAGVILVAHDRWFLEAVTNATLELEAGRATYFPGPWHAWRREKAERALHAQKTAARIGEDIERLERFVARFRYKKSKARQAQAKLTQIERLEQERSRASSQHSLLTRRSRRLGFDFLEPPRSGRVVLEVEDATVAAGGRELLRRVNLALDRGEHAALVGPNGSGKTTLLEEIVAGRHRLGYGVEVGYFPQQEIHLDERGSVLDCVNAMTGLTRPKAQSLLGRFLFSGWEAHEKPVTALSGGERRRLALAILVASGANFLILDEPTNHLDLESREALEAALEAFPGTVLIVSHDRALLDAVAHRTAAIEGGEVRVYDGGWADYLERREQRPAESKPTKRAESKPTKRAKPRAVKHNRGPGPLEAIEARIEAQERLIAGLEARLAEDWADTDAVAAYQAARAKLATLMARWEELIDEAAS
jgi:ATP-binding cassette subfamily F protein 3